MHIWLLTLTIQKSISEEQDEFQQIVLSVVQKEVVPEFKTLKGKNALTNSPMNRVLKISVTELCTNCNWLTSPTAKQGFCWGVVATCCSMIALDEESFEWTFNYKFLISQLGLIYKAYCDGEGLQGEDEMLLREQFAPTVIFNDDIKK